MPNKRKKFTSSHELGKWLLRNPDVPLLTPAVEEYQIIKDAELEMLPLKISITTFYEDAEAMENPFRALIVSPWHDIEGE